MKNENDPYAYKIQKLGQKYLLLQKLALSKPEGYEILSVREVTEMFSELKQTAVWFLGIFMERGNLKNQSMNMKREMHPLWER